MKKMLSFALWLLLLPAISMAGTYGQFVELGPYYNAGVLVSGAKIYHYAAGTTTLQNCWADRAKVSAVAQPLVADANGVASMYCDGIYKLVIKTSADVTLYTFDNVSIADQTSATDGEGTALASASTLTLGTDGNFFHVTGANPISAISGTQTKVWLAFDGAATLTHSGVLILQNAVNYTPASGDVFVFINEGAGAWRETSRSNPKLALYSATALGGLGTTPRMSSATAFGFGAQAGYRHGLTLSNNGSDATNDIDIAIGEASNTATTYASRVVMTLGTAITKRLDAAWVTGTNQGGLSSSLVAGLTNTTYHVCLIRVAGVDDVGFDTSATCANLVTDHSATHYRRIGSIMREGAAIVAFVQDGRNFRRKASILDVSATNPGASAVAATLSLPSGLNLQALINVSFTSSTDATAEYLYISDLSATDEVASASAAPLSQFLATNSFNINGQLLVRTNTTPAIRYRCSGSDGNTIVRIATLGWIDHLGMDY